MSNIAKGTLVIGLALGTVACGGLEFDTGTEEENRENNREQGNQREGLAGLLGGNGNGNGNSSGGGLGGLLGGGNGGGSPGGSGWEEPEDPYYEGGPSGPGQPPPPEDPTVACLVDLCSYEIDMCSAGCARILDCAIESGCSDESCWESCTAGESEDAVYEVVNFLECANICI